MDCHSILADRRKNSVAVGEIHLTSRGLLQRFANNRIHARTVHSRANDSIRDMNFYRDKDTFGLNQAMLEEAVARSKNVVNDRISRISRRVLLGFRVVGRTKRGGTECSSGGILEVVVNYAVDEDHGKYWANIRAVGDNKINIEELIHIFRIE